MIGILGGMGAFAGLSLCEHLMREAVKKGATKDTDFPKLLYYNLPCQGMDETGIVDSQLVLGQLRGVIGRMESFGCDVIVPACNSVMRFHGKLQGLYSGTLINPVESACCRVERGQPVGVICSQSTKSDQLYEEFLLRKGAMPVPTTAPEQAEVNQVIGDVMAGKSSHTDALVLHSVICNLKARGASTIILGCTELGLANEISSSAPIIDAGFSAVEDALCFNG